MSALILTALLMTAAQAEDSAKKAKELQKERLALLEKIVDQAITRFRGAQGPYEEVLEAQMQLLQARLDAVEKESERIAIYGQAVEVLKKSEKLAQAQIDAGRRTELELFKFKARRLEIEIQLEKATIKEANQKTEDPTRKVKDLQRERIDVLKQAVVISLKLAQACRAEAGEALEARMSLLKAEVEGAESDRITLYEDALRDLTTYAGLAKIQFEAGRASEISFLKVKARLLEVQIQLEKMKEAKGKK